MHRRSPPFALAVLALAAAASALLAARTPAHARPPEPPESFDALVDRLYADYSRVSPSSATELGIHDHDGDLEDFSPEAIAAESSRLHAFAGRFAALDPAALSPAQQIDLALVRASLDASLLDLERVQSWRHRPDVYAALANEAVFALVKRSFAPEADRLASVVAREEKIPRLLEQAAANLDRVPRIHVETTLEELPGVVSFFREDVPRAFPAILGKPAGTFAPDSREAKLVTAFAAANEGAVRALEAYKKHLEEKVLPAAVPDFALGAELFRAKLHSEEMIDEPLEPLLARGEAELARLQAEFKKTAAAIDPAKSAADVQRSVLADHPAANEVIPETQKRLAALRRFLVDRAIVTVPSEVMPTVEETPAFMRATTLASMSTPGPFETRATEAYYHLTLPEADWSKEKAEEFLAGSLSRPTLDVTSIHEAFPGHYVQFLWLPRVTSKVRKFVGAGSSSEGWAHYCEQMLLDEGWGSGDAKLRLAQIQDALLRAARYVAAIRLHTRGMTLSECQTFFVEQGYQSKEVAEVESRRGAGDPTYLVYTWGKLELLKLREDVRNAQGSGFSLKNFHDSVLAEGAIPLPLLRRALLGASPAAPSPEVAADIHRWVHTLESKNGFLSLDALDYLPYFGRAAVPDLVAELSSASSTGRVLAAVALGRIPDARAVEPLLQVLDDKTALDLATLSESGDRAEPVYPGPELTLGQQARIALESITGQHHAKAADWRAWWEKARASFHAPEPRRDTWPALPRETKHLKGVRIVVDPGHGGDRDKRGYKRGLTYLSEADVNLRVGRYLRDLLEKAGAVPILTRDGDTDVSLKARATLPATAHADLFVSVHHNWTIRLDTVNTSTWYHLTPDEKPASLDLARFVQAGVAEAFALEEPPASGLMSDRLIYESGFGVLRDLPRDVPGCLCEATYYSNFGMEQKLRDLATLRKEAWGFLVGLSRYLAAGVPRAKVASATRTHLVLDVNDGIEGRGEWTLPHQIFAEHVIVKIDGETAPHTFDREKGRIVVEGVFAPGDHEAHVVLLNASKNHSWPKRLPFHVE